MLVKWFKEHVLEAVGTLFAVLTYFNIGPVKLVKVLDSFRFLIYITCGVLIGWGACRTWYGFGRRSRKPSEAELIERERQFQEGFVKAPYWIKAFIKTVLDKGAVYTEADSFYFENYSDFILQFLSYRTVGDEMWQFTMREDAKEYFSANPGLLIDVKDEDIERHARKKGMRAYRPYCANGLDWWYYSESD